jgi:hypothetical protein
VAVDLVGQAEAQLLLRRLVVARRELVLRQMDATAVMERLTPVVVAVVVVLEEVA